MPLDLRAAKLGIRARVLATVVASTGSITLTATTSGYTRDAGSFITDGFVVGLEVTPLGFSANTVDVIDSVTDLTITTKRARAAQASGAGRSLTAYLPQTHALNGDTVQLRPGYPAWREEFVPAPPETITMSPNGGRTNDSGLYFATLILGQEYGDLAMDAMTSAILARFTSGTQIAADDAVLWVPWRNGASPGQLKPYDTPGVNYQQIRIPWNAQSRAAVLP